MRWMLLVSVCQEEVLLSSLQLLLYHVVQVIKVCHSQKVLVLLLIFFYLKIFFSILAPPPPRGLPFKA